MPIPVQANFRARGMAPNVVGGQRLDQRFSSEYLDTATAVVASNSVNIVPGRIVMYEPLGNTDVNNAYRGRRLGVKAVTAAFTAADFAGVLMRRYATPVYGTIPDANTVNDTATEANIRPGNVVSRGVTGRWWIEFDSATAPATGAAVFVDNTAGSITAGLQGRVSASAGVSLTAAVAVFTGDHEQGWDGKYYAGVRFVTQVN